MKNNLWLHCFNENLIKKFRQKIKTGKTFKKLDESLIIPYFKFDPIIKDDIIFFINETNDGICFLGKVIKIHNNVFEKRPDNYKKIKYEDKLTADFNVDMHIKRNDLEKTKIIKNIILKNSNKITDKVRKPLLIVPLLNESKEQFKNIFLI